MEEFTGLSNFVNWALLTISLLAFMFLAVSYIRLMVVAERQGREHDPLEAPWFPSTVVGLFVIVMVLVLLYVPATDNLILFGLLTFVFTVFAFIAGAAHIERRKEWLEEGPEAY